MSSPPSQVATIVGEVASVIVAASALLPLEVTVLASRLPMAELADLAENLPVRVTVVPHLPDGRSVVQQSRGISEDTLEVDIGIQRRVPTGDNGEPDGESIDALLALSEAVANIFIPGRLPTSDASWVRTVHSVLYDPAHLLQHSTFTGVITVTYAVHRHT